MTLAEMNRNFANINGMAFNVDSKNAYLALNVARLKVVLNKLAMLFDLQP